MPYTRKHVTTRNEVILSAEEVQEAVQEYLRNREVDVPETDTEWHWSEEETVENAPLSLSITWEVNQESVGDEAS